MATSIPKEILDELKDYPVSYRLQQIRLHLGYTQREAAELIGCTQNSVSTWENGNSPPSAKNLLKIVQAYGLPNNYFVDLKIEKVERIMLKKKQQENTRQKVIVRRKQRKIRKNKHYEMN